MKWGSKHGLFTLRVALGLLFLVAGIGKLTDPTGTAAYFASIGIPLAAVAAWLVILAEVLGGAALLVGWRTKWAVVPLGVVMLVATFFVALPGAISTGNALNVLFHLLALAGLKTMYLAGPGAWALKGK